MTKLVDKFGRVHDYLRISITDNCNFRCSYCMPEETFQLTPQQFTMTKDEIIQIAETFKSLGVKKLRLTGGEPLMRKDFPEIILELSKLELELHLTTNGLLIKKHIETLKKANVKGINISIDSLKNDRFKLITKRDYLDRVLDNIKLAKDSGIQVKLNVVALKDFNKDEILDFAQYAFDHNLSVRFIEFMPFNGNKWETDKLISFKEIVDCLETKFDLIPIEKGINETSRTFKIENSEGSIGIISSVSNPFCGDCNRLRITSDGKIKNCLFGTEEFDLLTLMREKKPIKELIQKSIESKHFSRGGLKEFQNQNLIDFEKNRSMIKIGG